jgi:hypothetical protein
MDLNFAANNILILGTNQWGKLRILSRKILYFLCEQRTDVQAGSCQHIIKGISAHNVMISFFWVLIFMPLHLLIHLLYIHSLPPFTYTS